MDTAPVAHHFMYNINLQSYRLHDMMECSEVSTGNQACIVLSYNYVVESAAIVYQFLVS